MKPNEIAMLHRHLRPNISYLEFGCGGSTLLALKNGVKSCHSVDSDLTWINRLRQEGSIHLAEASGRLTFHHVNIGPLLNWGMPSDTSRLAHWPEYFLSVWGKLENDPDVVLIDGRFRTACGLISLLLCPLGTTILMHDFFDTHPIRVNYQSLLKVADIAERASQLISLKRKPNVLQRQLATQLQSVWTDFA